MSRSFGPSFHDGFELTEEKLRRLHDLAVQRIKRATTNPMLTYKLRYKNNATKLDFTSLDEVILETHGGNQIIESLLIEMKEPQSSEITFEFIWPNNLGQVSMRYRIYGDEDWAKVTYTELQVKIEGIKDFSFALLLYKPLFASVAILLEGLVGIHLVASIIVLISHSSLPIIPFGAPLSTLVAETVFLIATLSTIWVGFFFFPTYNFCWGDYASKVQKRRNMGNRILTTVWGIFVAGILVSVISYIITAGIHV